jgi:hypothetical protein
MMTLRTGISVSGVHDDIEACDMVYMMTLRTVISISGVYDDLDDCDVHIALII